MTDDNMILTVLGICLICAGITALVIYIFVHWFVRMITRCNHEWCPTDTLIGWSVVCRHCNMEIMSNLSENVATAKAAHMNGEEPKWREYPTDFPDAKWKKGKKDG